MRLLQRLLQEPETPLARIRWRKRNRRLRFLAYLLAVGLTIGGYQLTMYWLRNVPLSFAMVVLGVFAAALALRSFFNAFIDNP